MTHSQAVGPEEPVTLLLLKSRSHTFLAWLLAGPLTPVFWLWMLEIFRVSPGVQQPEPTLIVFVGRWMFIGLPSTIAVSIGLLLYVRLKRKEKDKVYLAAFRAALITLVLVLACLSVALAILESQEGRNPVFAILSVLGIGGFIGSIAAIPMALVSFGVIRLIALRPEVLPRS